MVSRPRILLSNDDGPPGPKSRYIGPFHQALVARGFDVSVCLPATHKSWAGKGIDPGQEVTLSMKFFGQGSAWWLCEGASPAAATNIGLHHMHGPFDLVISGPNFGRNTASSFLLSSGTLGCALEGAFVGIKGIAISFNNESKEALQGDAGRASHEEIAAGCEVSVDLVDRLWQHWPSGVEVFNINVPVNSAAPRNVVHTCVDTRVSYNSVYREIKDETGLTKFTFAMGHVGDRPGYPMPERSHLPTDKDALNSGFISVTPLRSNIAAADCDLTFLQSGDSKLNYKYAIPLLAPCLSPLSLSIGIAIGAFMVLCASRL